MEKITEKGRCSNSDCFAHDDQICHEGKENYKECECWLENNQEDIKTKNDEILETSEVEENETILEAENTEQITWNGEFLKKEHIHLISSRNQPNIIGLAGKVKAGKTSFLGMLYTLLINGYTLEKYSFAGSKTIIGWDKLYFDLTVKNGKVDFSEPTGTQNLNLLHLALKEKEKLNDVLLADTSGEAFSIWSRDMEHENAKNARWIYNNANCFILFMDCEDLAENKNVAKTEIIDIAQMLNNNLNNRPVIAVWSKSDKKGEIHERIQKSLSSELEGIFENYTEIDVSNLSKEDPDKLVHENNLKVIDWLLTQVNVPTNEKLVINTDYENDNFLNYKGR